MEKNFQPVEKEIINNLKFPKCDVLSDESAKKFRQMELERALRLGNGEKVKINIYFEDERSKLKVNTTIWGLTEERVILKRGITIPINRIHRLD